GLFVESGPLPLRTRRTLKVSVGGQMTAVSIEADVVFAAGGRVGFSVVHVSEAKVALEKVLGGLASNSPKGQGSTLDGTPQIVRSSAPEPGAPIPSFSGRILKPMNLGELLDFQNRRSKSAGELTQAPTLNVFEFISRQSAKGVLAMRSGEAKMTIYFHEGS